MVRRTLSQTQTGRSMRTVLPGERHELCPLCTYALLAHEKRWVTRSGRRISGGSGKGAKRVPGVETAIALPAPGGQARVFCLSEDTPRNLRERTKNVAILRFGRWSFCQRVNLGCYRLRLTTCRICLGLFLLTFFVVSAVYLTGDDLIERQKMLLKALTNTEVVFFERLRDIDYKINRLVASLPAGRSVGPETHHAQALDTLLTSLNDILSVADPLPSPPRMPEASGHSSNDLAVALPHAQHVLPACEHLSRPLFPDRLTSGWPRPDLTSTTLNSDFLFETVIRVR